MKYYQFAKKSRRIAVLSSKMRADISIGGAHEQEGSAFPREECTRPFRIQ
jgi:hypothetical protein